MKSTLRLTKRCMKKGDILKSGAHVHRPCLSERCSKAITVSCCSPLLLSVLLTVLSAVQKMDQGLNVYRDYRSIQLRNDPLLINSRFYQQPDVPLKKMQDVQLCFNTYPLWCCKYLAVQIIIKPTWFFHGASKEVCSGGGET